MVSGYLPILSTMLAKSSVDKSGIVDRVFFPGKVRSMFLSDYNEANPMHVALDAYLSDMPESEKLAIVTAQWADYARLVEIFAEEAVTCGDCLVSRQRSRTCGLWA